MKHVLLILSILAACLAENTAAQSNDPSAVVSFENGVITIEMRDRLFSSVQVSSAGGVFIIQGARDTTIVNAGTGATQLGIDKVQVSAGSNRVGIRGFNSSQSSRSGIRFVGNFELGAGNINIDSRINIGVDGAISTSSGDINFGGGAFIDGAITTSSGNVSLGGDITITELGSIVTATGSVAINGGEIELQYGADIEVGGSGTLSLNGSYIRTIAHVSGRDGNLDLLSKIKSHDGDISLLAIDSGISLTALIESTGKGNININGNALNGTSARDSSSGVRIVRNNDPSAEAFGAAVVARNGTVSISGEGLNHGIELSGDIRVNPGNEQESTDGIILTGLGNNSHPGIVVSQPLHSRSTEIPIVISSGRKNIRIAGEGPKSTSGIDSAAGVELRDVEIKSGGRGDITIVGMGGTGDGTINWGVHLPAFSNQLIQTELGDISISASAESRPNGTSAGLGSFGNATIESTQGGNINIIAKAASPFDIAFESSFGFAKIGSAVMTGDIYIHADAVQLHRMELRSKGELHFNPVTTGRNVIIDGIIPFSNSPHPDLPTSLVLGPNELLAIQEGFDLIQIGAEPTFDADTGEQSGGVGKVTVLDRPTFNTTVILNGVNIDVGSINAGENVVALIASNRIVNLGSAIPLLEAGTTTLFSKQLKVDGLLSTKGNLDMNSIDPSDFDAVLKLSIDSAGEGGSDYDQIRLLDSATEISLGSFILDLAVNANYQPAAGDEFRIIDLVSSDASVSGVLHRMGEAGSIALEEGSNIAIDEKEFTISYRGGDGNDVTLTFEGEGELIAQCLPTLEGGLFNELNPATGETEGFLAVTADLLDAGSVSPAGIVSRTVTPTSLTCADVGVPKTFTLLVEDNNGATESCSTIVNTTDVLDVCPPPIDTEAPVAKCELDLTVRLDDKGVATLTPNQLDIGSSDNVRIMDLAVTPSQLSCMDVGTTTLAKLLVTDTSENFASCTTNLSVLNGFNNICGLDEEPPVAKCRDTELQIPDEGFASITAAMLNNGSTDNVGITDLSLDRSTFLCEDVGKLAAVFLTVADEVGNTASCTSYVSIKDDNTAACSTGISEEPESDITIFSGIVEGGDLRDVTVEEGGVIDGARVSGFVENRGTIRDTLLSLHTDIQGGVVTGIIRGTSNIPGAFGRINAIIDKDASLINVVVGRDAEVDPKAFIGRGVRFEDLAGLPADLDLTHALGDIIWDESPLPAVDLNESLGVLGGSEMSLLESMQSLDEFGPAEFGIEQDGANGELSVIGEDLDARVLPVKVRQAVSDVPQGIGFNEDGDLSLVNATRQEVIGFPLLTDEQQLRRSVGSIIIEFDERANIIAELDSSEAGSRAVGRPSIGAVPAAPGRVLGLGTVPHAELQNINLVSLIFEGDDGQLLEQQILPMPADWLELKATLRLIEGVSDVRISTNGVISMVVDGIKIRALMDYEVRSGTSSGGDTVEFRPLGDLNGDGIGDIELVYSNGDQQFAFGLP